MRSFFYDVLTTVILVAVIIAVLRFFVIVLDYYHLDALVV